MEMTDVRNKVEENRAKAYFLSMAIPKMWDGDQYPDEIVLGAQIFMREVVRDLEEIGKQLQKEREVLNGKSSQ